MKNIISRSIDKLAFPYVVMVFGVNFIFVRICLREMPPFWTSALRFYISAAILFVLMKYRKMDVPKGKDLIRPAVYGILSFGISAGLLSAALIKAPASYASIVYAAVPLLTILLSGICRTEKIKAKGIVCSLIVFYGIFLAFKNGVSSAVPLSSLILLFIAAISVAASGIAVSKIKYLNPIAINLVGMSWGAILLTLISVLNNENISLPRHSSTFLSLAWLIVSSGSAFITTTYLVKKLKATSVSYTSVLSPLVTLTACFITGVEKFNIIYVAGASVVLAGVLLNRINTDKILTSHFYQSRILPTMKFVSFFLITNLLREVK